MFLLFEFVCGTPQSPLVLVLIGTKLGLGLGGLGAKVLGTGLDNFINYGHLWPNRLALLCDTVALSA